MVTTPAPAGIEPAEIAGLATLLAHAYVRVVDTYYQEWQLPLPEAAKRARAPITEEMALTALDYKHVSFWSIGRLAEKEPEAALRLWAEIKRLAAEEWQSGQRAAAVLGLENEPWQRAQFLMIRQGFINEWQPTGDVERALLEMLAQAFFSWQLWLERITMWVEMENIQTGNRRGNRPEHTGLVTTFEAIEQATTMADRFNRLFLRTLRALRDLRRYTPVVTINNPQQVNVGTQQVNVSSAAIETHTGANQRQA
jgi:hypothetical protein